MAARRPIAEKAPAPERAGALAHAAHRNGGQTDTAAERPRKHAPTSQICATGATQANDPEAGGSASEATFGPKGRGASRAPARRPNNDCTVLYCTVLILHCTVQVRRGAVRRRGGGGG